MKMLYGYIFGLLLSGAAALGAEDEVPIRPYVIGALGDSISAGFNSYRLGDNRNLNWASGLDPTGIVESHALRLKEIVGRPIEIHNEAFVGATSADIARETDRLLRYKPDYVTFLIGANDICNWLGNYEEALTAYKQRINDSISRLIASNHNIKIVMLSIPDLMHVRTIGLANRCQPTWNSIGLCKPLFDPARTPDELEQFSERFQTLNQIIADVAAAYSANVKYKSEILSYQFPREFLSSIDCFHPSVLGHNKIAELTFDPTWH